MSNEETITDIEMIMEQNVEKISILKKQISDIKKENRALETTLVILRGE